MNAIFGLFGKKKKPKSALDEWIISIYGNPPPPKRANTGEAVKLAGELLRSRIDEKEISKHAIALNDGPIPYSTHDLALSVALHFFKQPEHMPQLSEAQLLARMKMLEWLEKGSIAPLLGKSFENVLYKLYKPTPQHEERIKTQTEIASLVASALDHILRDSGAKSILLGSLVLGKGFLLSFHTGVPAKGTNIAVVAISRLKEAEIFATFISRAGPTCLYSLARSDKWIPCGFKLPWASAAVG